MGTLASLLDIARQALMADQFGLNVTANNVANQNTQGYTRETASFQSVDSISLSGASQSTGVTAIESSQRDRILEQRVQQQTQVAAQSGALGSALQQVENIFSLSATSSGSGAVSSSELGGAINTFFSSLSSLERDPSGTATRQSVLSAATALAGAFNDASNQLAQISSSLNQEVSSDVSQVNSLTSSIASLNSQIASASPNGDAGTLEDQRQEDIDQLSQLVGLDQISTSQNGISLTTSSGATLVSGSQSFQMSATQIGKNVDVFAGDPPQDVTSSLTGGDIGGAIQARDQSLPAYSSSLDELAFALGNAVNAQNEAGVDSSGNPGQAIFSVPSSAAGAAASIAVSATDPGAVAAASSGEGSAGNENATALANLSSTAMVGSQTATSFFSSLLGQIGSDASGAATDSTAQLAALTQLTSQRDSLSGVSLDEEASNLTQYERSYQAASQVFTIVDSLMASVINLGVETAVT
jgi:flagellar hook-associated protein 1 FlgK